VGGGEVDGRGIHIECSRGGRELLREELKIGCAEGKGMGGVRCSVRDGADGERIGVGINDGIEVP